MEVDFEAGLFEGEVLELLSGGFTKAGNGRAPLLGKIVAEVLELQLGVVKLFLEMEQLFIAGGEGAEFLLGGLEESEDFGDVPAVLSFKILDEVKAVFELLEACGVDVELVLVSGELALEVNEQVVDGGMVGEQGLSAGVGAGDFLEGTGEGAGQGEDGWILFAEEAEGGLGELIEFG